MRPRSIKVTPDSARSTLLDDGLFFSTSSALQEPRRIFVTNRGVCLGGGEIWQVHL